MAVSFVFVMDNDELDRAARLLRLTHASRTGGHESFASKVRSCTWIYVSATCGSGWVDDEYAILLGILNSDG